MKVEKELTELQNDGNTDDSLSPNLERLPTGRTPTKWETDKPLVNMNDKEPEADAKPICGEASVKKVSENCVYPTETQKLLQFILQLLRW